MKFHAVPIVVLFTALLLSAGGCGASRAPAGAFVGQAERLHQTIAPLAATRDADLNEYIGLLGKRLADAAKREVPDRAAAFPAMQFHLVYSDSVNAFATGGPHVYVCSGLVRECQSEEELAAAIAHAYAHAINLDVEETGMRPEANMPLRLMLWQFITNRFTPDQEQAADQLAYRLYCRAGYDPAMFQNIFQRLGDVYAAVPVARGRAPLPQRAQLASAGARRPDRDWRQLPVADPQTFQALKQTALSPGGRPPPGAGAEAAGIILSAFPNCILSGDTPDQTAAQERLRPQPPAATLDAN